MIEAFYGPIGQEGVAELERYSDAELAFLRDFLRRGRELQMRHAARIRSSGNDSSSDAGGSRPRLEDAQHPQSPPARARGKCRYWFQAA